MAGEDQARTSSQQAGRDPRPNAQSSRPNRFFEGLLLLSGGYAWWLTVAPALFSTEAGLGWLAAALAPAFLVFALVSRSSRLRTWLGIDAFLFLSLLAWLQLPRQPSASDANFGVFAWLLFALCWGLSDAPLARASSESAPLLPRRKLRPGPILLHALTTAVSLYLLTRPAEIPRQSARVFGYFVALAAILLLQYFGAKLAADLQLPAEKRGRRSDLLLPTSLFVVLACASFFFGR